MPWVTEEEIQAAKNMTAYEYLRTHQAQRLQKTRTRNEWQLTDHDSFKINELSSKWHWKSRDIGGVSALRFLIEVDGMKFTDAVKLLCEESPSFFPTQSVEKEKPPFKLPERFLNCRRIRAYLNHRGVSDAVISDSILRMQLSFNMMRFGIGRYILVMVFAFVMLTAGIVMLFNPIKSAAAATTVMGVCMMVDGIMNIISVIFAKKLLEE